MTPSQICKAFVRNVLIQGSFDQIHLILERNWGVQFTFVHGITRVDYVVQTFVLSIADIACFLGRLSRDRHFDASARL